MSGIGWFADRLLLDDNPTTPAVLQLGRNGRHAVYVRCCLTISSIAGIAPGGTMALYWSAASVMM